MTYSRVEVMEWLEELEAGQLDLNIDNTGLAVACLALLSGAPVPSSEPQLPEGYLSPHFTLAELIYSDTAQSLGIDNTPTPEAVEQLEQLALVTLEGIRMICGGATMTITSGYRCPDLNAAVGGVGDSAHLYGCAADFVMPSVGNPTELVAMIKPYLAELQIDQLIDECSSQGDRWVHVGRAVPPNVPRHQCFAV